MHKEKVSVTLPRPLKQFIEEYRASHAGKSRSEVVEEALELLRQRELEQAYREASREIDPAWEATVADGLDDEAW